MSASREQMEAVVGKAGYTGEQIIEAGLDAIYKDIFNAYVRNDKKSLARLNSHSGRSDGPEGNA